MYATVGDAVHIVVGNKIDTMQRKVTREQGIEFAKEQRALFVETSALNNEGVTQAFEELVMQILETPTLKDITRRKVKDANSNGLVKIRNKKKRTDEFDVSQCCRVV